MRFINGYYQFQHMRQNPEGDGGGGGGGGDDAAAKAAAEKAAADKAAADKVAADKAAADAAAAEAERAKAALKEAEAKLAAFNGIDPEKYRKLVADQEAAEQVALEAKGDWERLREKMAAAHTTELEAASARTREMEERLNSTSAIIERLTIGSAFDTSPYIKTELILTPAKARTVFGSHFDVEGDAVVGYDKPRGEAGRTKLVDARGNPVAFEVALKTIVEADTDRDSLLRSKLKTGAGSDTLPNGKPDKVAKPVRGLARIQAALNAGKTK